LTFNQDGSRNILANGIKQTPSPFDRGRVRGGGVQVFEDKRLDKEVARRLRKNSTDTERALWYQIRNSAIEGVKFRRQQPIGPYVADFVSFQEKIIVELDGGQHAVNIESDQVRDSYLREKGYRVLRFWNNEVLESMAGVLEVI